MERIDMASGLTHTKLDLQLGRAPPEKLTLKQHKDRLKKRIKTFDYGKFASDRFPIAKQLRNYNVRSDLLRDFLSGVSGGMAMIPQAMGYATVLGVPVVYGLYSIVFSSLIYTLFTTSMHASCTIAISGVIFARDALQGIDLPEINGTFDGDELPPAMIARLHAIYSLTFIGGIVIIVATLCRFSILIEFSSEAHMGGIFGAVTAVVLINQVPPLLGIYPDSFSGFLQTPKYIIDILKHLPDSNVPTVVVSIVSLIILFFFKEFINVKFEQKLPAPIPIDIILLVVTTAISYIWDWADRYEIAVIGTIPSGVPTPEFPLEADWADFIKPGIVFGLISYLAAPVMYRHFAAKHGYQVEMSQESSALGVSFILSSCISNVGLGVSASRIFMMESCGGRTQTSYIFAALTSLAVITLLADYGNTLPKCVVAAILVVTFSRASVNFKRIRKYWRRDKVYFVIWVFTFCVAMLFTVSDGIIYGFGLSIVIAALQTVFPKVSELQECYLDDERYLVDIKKYKQSTPLKTTRIISVSGPIYFANINKVKTDINALLENKSLAMDGVTTVIANDMHTHEDVAKLNGNVTTICNGANNYINNLTINGVIPPSSIHPEKHKLSKHEAPRVVSMIVLDFSNVAFIDTAALRMLVALKLKLSHNHVTLCIAACNESVRRSLRLAPNVMSKLDDRVYACVDDAVRAGCGIEGHGQCAADSDSDDDDCDVVTSL